MHPHSHHVQLPHHHANISVRNVRKQLLDFSKTKLGCKCIAIIIPLAVIVAVLSFGFKFVSGLGDLGHKISGANDFSPYTSLVFPISTRSLLFVTGYEKRDRLGFFMKIEFLV